MSIRLPGQYRGVEDRDIASRSSTRRDPRRMGEKIVDFLNSNEISMFFILFAAIVSAVFPFFLFITIPVVLGFYNFRMSKIKNQMLPARLPMSSNRKDMSDPIPNTKDRKHFNAGGIFHIGNERMNDQEVWLADKDILTHMLIFGTTGAGKALPMDEDVLTPNGFVKMACIKVGDEVISIDGKPTEVTGVYPQGVEDVYLIKLEDGREVEASNDHLWEVECEERPFVLTTGQLSNTLSNHDDKEIFIVLSKPYVMKSHSSVKLDYSLSDLEAMLSEPLVSDDLFVRLPVERRDELLQQALGKDIFDELAIKRLQYIGWSLGMQTNINMTKESLHGRASTKYKIELAVNVFKVKIESISHSGKKETQCIKVADSRSLFLTRNFIPTHNTETLVSLTFNAIALGSGLFYVDPKAAPKLAFQIFVMARVLGREHDFLAINYSVKSKSPYRYNPKRITNSVNPFSLGSAEALSELLTALIPASEGDNAVFSNGAQTMIKALMYGLVEKRNSKEIPLSIATIRKYTVLDSYVELATDKTVSLESRNAMQGYLSSVGWKEGMAPSKLQDVSRQHGFSLSYFSLALANLTDTYGHIYLKAKGELDNTDVIKYRRIAVILLPSLEMSPPQLKNVGQITLSAVRNATAIGLGDRLEGTVEDVIDALPTNSPVPGIVLPFLVVTDEYAAIPTPGYAEVLTQGRGLGIAAIVASQDYAGIKGADEKGAKQIVANTKFKAIMAMDDPEDTWDLVEKISGQVEVSVVGGYDAKDSTFGNYRDNASVSLEKRAMVDIKDLQSQIEGEFHGFFKGKLIRGSSFYANPPLPKKLALKINHKIGIEDIDKRVIDNRYGRVKEMTDKVGVIINNGGISKQKAGQMIELSDRQKKVLLALTGAFNSNPLKNPNDRAITAFMLVNHMVKDSGSPIGDLIKTQQEASSGVQAQQEAQQKSHDSGAKEIVKGDSLFDDDDLPSFAGISLGDDDDDSDEVDLVEVPNPKRVLQKKMYKSLLEGGEILSNTEKQAQMKSDVRMIEQQINPGADMKKLDESLDKVLGAAVHMESPLPEIKKEEEVMLSDVQRILSVVKKNKD